MANLSDPPSSSSGLPYVDPRIQFTFDIVDWDALSSLGRKLHQADSSYWGEQICGGYNLVRFLHLRDSDDSTLVARVPLRSEGSASVEHDFAISKRIASEVATMEYIESYTNIPVPHVFLHAVHAEESKDVHSPFILMSHVAGVRLNLVWDDMEDDKRRIILRQVVDILLELWSHRFDKKGALFKKKDGGEGRDAWYIETSSVVEDPSKTGSRHRLLTTSYVHAADYWLAYANAYLQDIRNETFGSDGKEFDYVQTWFMRSIIPSLFDPIIDAPGLPLCPGDFHSQNIMIIDADTPNPRISAVIDWEFSGPDFATTFAWYPLFIMDHPAWEDDHPLRKRNVQDQATFDELLVEAEGKQAPQEGLPLSNLISNSYPIYLFIQTIFFPYTAEVFYPLLFAYIYGDDAKFRGKYYIALIDEGILKRKTERFNKEHHVWLEARKILGDDVVGSDLKTDEFKCLVLKNLDRFDNEVSVVREWLILNP